METSTVRVGYEGFVYNGDVKLRQERLEQLARPAKYLPGWTWDASVIRFEGLTAEGLRTLIDEGFVNPNLRQNEAPAPGQILFFMENNQGFTAHGFATHPDRFDYRIMIEGVFYPGLVTPEVERRARLFFYNADDFDLLPEGLWVWYD